MSYYTNFKRKGSNLFVRHVNEHGVESILKRPIEDAYYLETDEPTEFKNLSGKFLVKKVSERRSIREAISDYKASGLTTYGNSKPEYSLLNWLYDHEHFKPMSNKLRVLFHDIETEIDLERGFSKPHDPFMPINAIAIVCNDLRICISTIPYTGEGHENFVFEHYSSEKELLARYISLFKEINPHIICGYNSTAFDNPYIMKRIELNFSEAVAKTLSPFGSYSYREVVNKYGQKDLTVIIDGVADLDFLLLYRKYTPGSQKPSYKLDDVAFEELGENKVSYEGTLKDLYEKNPNKFLEYNATDTLLVQRLDNAKKYIMLVAEIAYIAKVNFEDTFYVTRVWDSIISNYLAKDSVVLPWASDDDKDEQYEGAFVLPPQVGYYDWVASFDVASMYPSLIIQQNISPECKVGRVEGIVPDDFLQLNDKTKAAIIDARKKGYTISANGALFRKDKQGFLPKLVSDVLDSRKVAKKTMQKYQRELEEVKEQLNKLGV